MCLKAQEPWSMPSETERIGRSLLAKDSADRLIGDKLFVTLNDQDFADLYPSEGSWCSGICQN